MVRHANCLGVGPFFPANCLFYEFLLGSIEKLSEILLILISLYKNHITTNMMAKKGKILNKLIVLEDWK